jgi:hypothetical protein
MPLAAVTATLITPLLGGFADTLAAAVQVPRMERVSARSWGRPGHNPLTGDVVAAIERAAHAGTRSRRPGRDPTRLDQRSRALRARHPRHALWRRPRLPPRHARALDSANARTRAGLLRSWPPHPGADGVPQRQPHRARAECLGAGQRWRAVPNSLSHRRRQGCRQRMPATQVSMRPLRRRPPCRPSRPRPAQTLQWDPLTPTRHGAAIGGAPFAGGGPGEVTGARDPSLPAWPVVSGG